MLLSKGTGTCCPRAVRPPNRTTKVLSITIVNAVVTLHRLIFIFTSTRSPRSFRTTDGAVIALSRFAPSFVYARSNTKPPHRCRDFFEQQLQWGGAGVMESVPPRGSGWVRSLVPVLRGIADAPTRYREVLTSCHC